MLTPETIKRYLEYGEKCPFCGEASHIEGGSVEIDGHYAKQSVTCTLCEKSWVDTFKRDCLLGENGRIITGLNPNSTLASEIEMRDESALDEMVHNHFSQMASAINNEGVEEQIRLLMAEGYEEHTLRRAAGL